MLVVNQVLIKLRVSPLVHAVQCTTVLAHLLAPNEVQLQAVCLRVGQCAVLRARDTGGSQGPQVLELIYLGGDVGII